MKSRFILFKRAGIFYSEDTVTHKQINLRTKADEFFGLTDGMKISSLKVFETKPQVGKTLRLRLPVADETSAVRLPSESVQSFAAAPAHMRGELLIRELKGDCLAVAFELPCPGRRRVIRAGARRLRCFQLPPIHLQSAAFFQLHGFG